MTGLIMRWRGEQTIGITLTPIGLTTKLCTMTRGALLLIDDSPLIDHR